MELQHQSRLFESLLGTAIGDSLGLPYEGLTSKRATKLLRRSIRPRLWFGRSFVSDDTMQSIFVLQSLYDSSGDVEAFQRALAHRLKLWFLAIPPGIGKSTILACLKIALGSKQGSTGINSGGNGAAMRSAIIGHWFADDMERRVEFTLACAKVTHAHPEAIMGAQIASLGASLATLGRLSELEEFVRAEYPEWPLERPRNRQGPSGYVVETMNAVIDICSGTQDFSEAIERAIRMGGDTDSTAAIVGGIICSRDSGRYKVVASPSLDMLKQIADGQLRKLTYVRMFTWHLAQIPVVLVFGLRRLLPQY